MIKRPRWLVVVLLALFLGGAPLIFWYSQQQALRIPQKLTDLKPERNAGQEPITPIPLDLGLDARKVRLGQRLFLDAQLSRDNTISCGHCHSLAASGVDNLPRSTGIDGRQGNINTPTLFNSGFNFRQFWDGRVATLEDAIDHELQNASTMGAAWPEIIRKLEKDAGYRRDFAALYKERVTPHTVKDAMGAFVFSLTTPNSRFDRYLRGEKNALNREELAGYDLFKSYGCISCHQGMNVGGNMYGKLGLVEDYFVHRGHTQEVDYGRYNLTRNESDRYKFRVPSLRNVALTAPYFHDASVKTLEGSIVIMGKYELGVDLREDEVAKIVKFLNTLTGQYQGEAGK